MYVYDTNLGKEWKNIKELSLIDFTFYQKKIETVSEIELLV